MDMNLSKLREMVRDGEAWCAKVHRVTENQTRLDNWKITTERILPIKLLNISIISHICLNFLMRTVKFYSHCKFQLNNTVLSACKLVTNLHIRPSDFIYLVPGKFISLSKFSLFLPPSLHTPAPPPPNPTSAPGNNFWFYVSVSCFWFETWVWSLGWEDPLVKGKATHSSILAWRVPWMI